VVIGYALMGMFHPLQLVFNIPEMIESVEILHPELNENKKGQLIDFSASIFTTFQFVFESVAPIYGTYVA
jgi:hypothetical protein